MKLTERLRKFWKEDETVLTEAAVHIEYQEARIKALEAALRAIVDWHDQPTGGDVLFSQYAKLLDGHIDRARKLLEE